MCPLSIAINLNAYLQNWSELSRRALDVCVQFSGCVSKAITYGFDDLLVESLYMFHADVAYTKCIAFFFFLFSSCHLVIEKY